MNLNRIQPKNEPEFLLISFTKNCETFFEQSHTKAKETLQFKLVKSRKNFFIQTTNLNRRIVDDSINGFRSI